MLKIFRFKSREPTWFHRLTMMGYLTTPDLPGRSGRSELPTIASKHVNLSASMGGAAVDLIASVQRGKCPKKLL